MVPSGDIAAHLTEPVLTRSFLWGSSKDNAQCIPTGGALTPPGHVRPALAHASKLQLIMGLHPWAVINTLPNH